MSNPAPQSPNRRMAELLMRLTKGQGIRPSALAGVSLMRSDAAHPRTPVLYEPSVVVIAQGHKVGHVGGRAYCYDAGHYLILSVPLPFECETYPAGPRRPMLGVSVRVHAAPLDAKLRGAAERLLECLDAPGEATVLGPQIRREVIYRALRGLHGDGLRALAATHGRLARIAATQERMHACPADPVEIAALAEDAAMSVSAFHEHFRAVTAPSPLAYLKSVRLHKARLLMAHDGLDAAEVAGRAGYGSASQFSREYRRLFGQPPARDVDRLRLESATPAPERDSSAGYSSRAYRFVPRRGCE